MARAKITIRAGNYAAEGDTAGMDEEMKATLTGTAMNKTEKAYVQGTGRKSSLEAVKRARKANKQPLVRP
jgi:hypothetical protein